MPGVYIHIPFCKQACSYCNFHFSTSLNKREEMFDSICREIELQTIFPQDQQITSLYLGGGTPSLLSEKELSLLFNKLRNYFNWSPGMEITLEANPDDITKEVCTTWKSLGVNRLSIGIQSILDKDLKWMNRAHSVQQALDCLPIAREAGFLNITCDLIYGIPGSNVTELEKSLDFLMENKINHVSAYALTVEEKTLLHHQVKKNIFLPPDEHDMEVQFVFLCQYLESKGFDHYEISNFGKPGFYAEHNTRYWQGDTYLGLGPSAHSFTGRSRRWNIANNALYMKSLAEGIIPFEEEILTPEELYNEYIMTGLRTIWGVDQDKLRDMGEQFEHHFLDQVKVFLEQKLVHVSNKNWTLTSQGKLFADRIASELFYITSSNTD